MNFLFLIAQTLVFVGGLWLLYAALPSKYKFPLLKRAILAGSFIVIAIAVFNGARNNGPRLTLESHNIQPPEKAEVKESPALIEDINRSTVFSDRLKNE